MLEMILALGEWFSEDDLIFMALIATMNIKNSRVFGGREMRKVRLKGRMQDAR